LYNFDALSARLKCIEIFKLFARLRRQNCTKSSLIDKSKIASSYYYKHLDQKSFLRCFLLVIPVIGNIIVGIYDFSKKKHDDNVVDDNVKDPIKVPQIDTLNISLDDTAGINSVQQNKDIKPYSILGQKALGFARKKLKEHPELAPRKFSSGYNSDETNQPINQEIALLTTLYWDVAFKNFKNLMKQNKENPWSNQEVIQAADECMKIAYAISNLTLDDLKLFTETLSSKGDNRTYAKALTRQDSYQYRTFYHCTNAYHWLRGEIAWRTNSHNKDQGGLFHPRSISETHASAFYQKGTIQNSWHELYNNYCDRVRLYVNEEELQRADNRHFMWTKKDTGVKSFSSAPDTQPT
jgi:hypothetical protein